MARKQHRPEPIDTKEAMSLFRNCSELFQVMTLDQKEKLADAILKSATVEKDKVVEFELYVGEDTGNVVQNVKVGSPALAIGQHRNGPTIFVKA
ncbi:MAG: hypothetical protein NTU88_13495, partial [Armatimonadetes bacterium]|nr:hypothetical protein [Armatimonadota bacterium]